MNKPKTSIKSKLFNIQGKNNSKVYFSDNKVYELNSSKKNVPIISLDETIKFSITKIQKTKDKTNFTFLIRSLAQDIYLKLEGQQDLNYCFKYVGYYGLAIGLQIIIADFLKLSKGSFATVFKLVTTFNSVKALKMFDKKRLEREKNEKSFLNQIKIMRMLTSPYLAQLQCVYETQKTYYLQMELFSQTLRSYLKRATTRGKQKQIMKHMLLALIELKAKNIIHRDIKPDNIMIRKTISGQEEFVIIDFGLSASLDQSDLIHKRCGTPGFIAPQIANEGDKANVSFSCDIFSLGATFFYILTKNKIFSGKDHKEILYKNKKMMLQEHLFYYLSVSEADLLNKMLQKDPSKRISAQQALKHPYFQFQIDQNDIICDQNCDLQSKLKDLKIMDTSFISEGVVFLYSFLKHTHSQKNAVHDSFTKNLADSDFHSSEDISQDQKSIEEQIHRMLSSKMNFQIPI